MSVFACAVWRLYIYIYMQSITRALPAHTCVYLDEYIIISYARIITTCKLSLIATINNNSLLPACKPLKWYFHVYKVTCWHGFIVIMCVVINADKIQKYNACMHGPVQKLHVKEKNSTWHTKCFAYMGTVTNFTTPCTAGLLVGHHAAKYNTCMAVCLKLCNKIDTCM